MFAKVVFLLVAGCASVLTSPVPDTANPLQGLSLNQLQTLQQQLAGTLQQGQQNIPQGLQELPGQLANVPQQTLQSIQQAVGELTSRLSNGYVNTYDQESESVQNTLNSVKDMGTKGVESGMNVIRNALELLFLLPKFGRNVLANGAQPQQQQQVWPQGQFQQRVY